MCFQSRIDQFAGFFGVFEMKEAGQAVEVEVVAEDGVLLMLREELWRGRLFLLFERPYLSSHWNTLPYRQSWSKTLSTDWQSPSQHCLKTKKLLILQKTIL
jgi:hypothetical protein